MAMAPHQDIERCARAVAAAIGARDIDTLRTLLDKDFVHRGPGQPGTDLSAFLEAIADIPGEIISVSLADLSIDVVGNAALATGIQRAEVRLDGQLISDNRGFVDWFVKTDGEWRIRVAVDLPATTPS
jgi:ketosteroid isomerase-like protein